MDPNKYLIPIREYSFAWGNLGILDGAEVGTFILVTGLASPGFQKWGEGIKPRDFKGLNLIRDELLKLG